MSPEVPETTDSSPTYRVTIEGDGVNVAKDVEAATATEILALIMGGSLAPASAHRGRASKRSSSRRSKSSTRTDAPTKPRQRRRSGSPSIVRDLSMRPSGKKSFADYVAEKQPKTHQQRHIVIVSWLRDQAGITSGITVDHVNTCYVEANWARPADLVNNLQVTAGHKGWLDTSNMADIKLTTRGEDEVKHNLPPRSTTKK